MASTMQAAVGEQFGKRLALREMNSRLIRKVLF